MVRPILVFDLLLGFRRLNVLFVYIDAHMLGHALKELLLELRTLFLYLACLLWSERRLFLELFPAFDLLFGLLELLFLLHLELDEFVNCLVPLVLVVYIEVEHLRQVDLCHLLVDSLHVRPDILLIEELALQLCAVDVVVEFADHSEP